MLAVCCRAVPGSSDGALGRHTGSGAFGIRGWVARNNVTRSAAPRFQRASQQHRPDPTTDPGQRMHATAAPSARRPARKPHSAPSDRHKHPRIGGCVCAVQSSCCLLRKRKPLLCVCVSVTESGRPPQPAPSAPRGVALHCKMMMLASSMAHAVYVKGISNLPACDGAAAVATCVTRTKQARQIAPRATTRGTAHPRNQPHAAHISTPTQHRHLRWPQPHSHTRMCQLACTVTLPDPLCPVLCLIDVC